MAKTKYPPTESMEQLTRSRDAWHRHAPETAYGNRPLDDINTGITELQQLDRQIDETEARLNALRSQRDDKLTFWMGFLRFIKHGVAADVRFGEDSVFYEELGYVRSSERKSGMTRKRKSEGGSDTGGGSKPA